MNDGTTKNPVFLDPSGRRWGRFRRAAIGVGFLTTLVAIVIVVGVLIPPALPAFASVVRAARGEVKGMRPESKARERARLNARKRFLASQGGVGGRARHLVPAAQPAPLQLGAGVKDPEVVGFYVNWDDNSYVSYAAHANEMDAVACEWLFVAPHGDSIFAKIDNRVFDVANSLPAARRPRVLAMLSNYSSENRHFDDGRLGKLLRSKLARERSLAMIANMVERRGLGGVVVDFENIPDALVPDLVRYLKELHAVLAPMGATLGQAVGADDDIAAIRRYAEVDDRVYLMLYDEHYGTSDPGPVASQQWYLARTNRLLGVVPPEKAILAVGAYGYDWNDGDGKTGSEMTFQDVMAAARDHHAALRFDREAMNPYLEWTEPDSTDHVVWYLDGVTAYDQMKATSSLGVAGHAVWRLGSEDPSLWRVLGRTGLDQPASALASIPFAGYDVEFKGNGEILRLDTAPDTGVRSVTLDTASTYVVAESISTVPAPWVIRRTGASPHRVALTFDDGPDGRWTPSVLDTLRHYHAPATFFVIGKNVERNIRLTQRIYAEGHEIGNHTFSHPNLALTEPWLTRLELGGTERVLEAVLDRRTALFRPPYFGDAEPTTQDELGPIGIADALGYVTAGVHVDSDDWRESDASQIVRNVLTQRPHGNVVLLHDGGGVRRPTIAALGTIIDSLRARGDTLVLLSELDGIPRSEAMPTLPPSSATTRFLELGSYALVGASQDIVHFVFALAIVLGLGRLAILTGLALGQRYRGRRRVVPSSDFAPQVTVIVPAYNEEKVILRTIASLLEQEYQGELDVVVVDDGSPDATFALAHSAYDSHPRVAVVSKPNGGKSTALNFGITRARGEIVVCLDADTIFMPNTVAELVAPLVDPNVGAVAGNAKVGNRINIVTRWQALEYVTSQNLDRRAFSIVNAITVVPGAVGAWRRDLVIAAGGFSHDTLAEDQDLTIAIRKMGKRIAYADEAVAYTEAPDTLGGLAKQRFRWSFGTLQCAWKYRRTLFAPRSGTLGWVALPNTWLFQLILTALSPIADLAFVWSLISVWIMKMQHGATYASESLERLVSMYALFLLVDWGAAILALIMEPNEEWGMTWLIFLQRFVYRQIMYGVVVRAFASAIRGKVVGWGKLERKATVQMRTA